MADFAAIQIIPNTAYNPVLGTNDPRPGIQLVNIGGGGSASTYYMRGYDGALAHLVYWTASFLDSAGSAYAGPGPLTLIVLLRKV